MSELGHSRRIDRAPFTSGLPRLADILRVSRHVSKVPATEVRLFDQLVTNGRAPATVIRAARLAAILPPIARGLRPAKGPARL
jgi:hypothetical protein